MRPFVLFAVIVMQARAQDSAGSDRYPEARALLLQAELAVAKIDPLNNGTRFKDWAARMYAQAGYLDDAARLHGPEVSEWTTLLRARVVYGDLAGVDRSLGKLANPQKKTAAMLQVADILWRMENRDESRAHYEAARVIALQVTDLKQRKQMLDAIEQGLQYVTEPPPDIISAQPHPKPPIKPSAVPPFPITPGGFAEPDRAQTAARSIADEQFLTRLYGSIATRNPEGLKSVVACASTPFQKALGMASLEHLAIQNSRPDEAEQFAMQIPEADPNCLLARAEALSATAATWLKTGDTDHAATDFNAALKIVEAVPNLPLGKTSVYVAIAVAQFQGGMTSSSEASFRSAMELADQLPRRPIVPFGQPIRITPGVHYRDEVYQSILVAAIRSHNLGVARQAADRWRTDGGTAVAITMTWLKSGQISEGAAFARTIVNPTERADAFLLLARGVLENAGVSNF